MLGQRSIKVNGADCGVEAILLGVITSIGGFLFGYDTGQISGMLLFTDFRDRFGQNGPPGDRTFDPITQATMVGLMSIGSLIGALSGAYTADWWGRRRSMTFGVGIFIIGNVIQITAMQSWVHMMMGRFVAGLGVGNLSVGVPMFQSECSPREIRGAVVASYQLMITIGILISNIVCYGFREIQTDSASWRVIIGLGIFFSLPLGIGILAVPESPRWLASRGDWEGAQLSLGRLRGMKHNLQHALVQDDLKEMRDILEKERQVGQGGWIECFNPNSGIPKLVWRTFLGFFIHFLQQWTGVNYFFYYGATIFESAGVEDPIQTQLILGAVNVATTFMGLWFVEKFGRRWPLFIGGIWQSVWLAIFAAVGTAMDPANNSTAGIVLIVCGCMFIASFASTWGPMAWVVIGESFPLRTRAKQASIATAGNWLGNFMVAFLTPLATDGISYAYGFVFAGTNLVAAVMIWFFLYESRTLSLENVDLMYGQPGLKPWNSHKWVPPGYITREQRDENYFRGNDKPRSSESNSAEDRVEAREFLSPFWESDRPTETMPDWEHLMTLSLTSGILTTCSIDGINDLLCAAARAVRKMPKLEMMELWSVDEHQISIFRYEVVDKVGEITWLGTHIMSLDTQVVKAWNETSEIHNQRYLRVQSCKIDNVDALGQAGAFLHLKLRNQILHCLLFLSHIHSRQSLSEQQNKTIYLISPPTIPSDMQKVMKDWHKPVLPKSAADPDLPKWTLSSTQAGELVNYLRAKVVQSPAAFAWRPWLESTRSATRTRSETAPKNTRVGLETPGKPEMFGVRCRPSLDGRARMQLHLGDVADVLLMRMPSDAYAVVMLTDIDLYEDQDDDFTVGRSWGGSRVSIVSSFRYNPSLDAPAGIDRAHMWPASHCRAFVDEECGGSNQEQTRPSKRKRTSDNESQTKPRTSSALGLAVEAAKNVPKLTTRDELASYWFARLAATVSHELGHCFGFAHCPYYACVMQGVSSIRQDGQVPPYLCPVCSAKLGWELGPLLSISGSRVEKQHVWIREQSVALSEFCGKWSHVPQFAGFAAWLGKRLEAMEGYERR
ncbi:hypothetical protein F66182_2236 [Fusarium sp. NRRL 66182]|nr:hypothetical protein F66182_2236 [Fusarium sp. NRRL 66182]